MREPKDLLEAIEQYIELVVTDPRSSDECRKTGRKLLSKIRGGHMNVQKWLTEEEVKEYECCLTTGGYSSSVIKDVYKSLAACRALLKKHQWAGTDKGGYEECPECKCTLIRRHTPDCTIATALQGVGGET